MPLSPDINSGLLCLLRCTFSDGVANQGKDGLDARRHSSCRKASLTHQMPSNFVPSSLTRKRSFLCVLPSCCGAWHAALQPLDVGDDGDDDDCMDGGSETKDLV